MNVTILYFAAVRDLAARSEDRMDVPDGVDTIAKLRSHLELAVPALAGRLEKVRFARNEAFAKDDERIEGGDVIALIPPVAGG